MTKKRSGRRPLKATVKIFLVRAWLNALSIMPGILAVCLFGGMVIMFIVVMADFACMDAQTFLVVAE